MPNHTEEGLGLLRQLIEDNHVECFSTDHWMAITETLMRIFESLIPTKSLNEYVEGVPEALKLSPSTLSLDDLKISGSDLNLSAIFPQQQSNRGEATSHSQQTIVHDPHEIHLLARRCSIQLLFLNMLRAITVECEPEESIIGPNSTLGFSSLKTILLMLLRAYEFAVSFNGNIGLRATIVKHRLAESIELVVLNQQESGTLSLLTGLLFDLYRAALTFEPKVIAIMELPVVQEEVALQYLKISEVALQRYVELKLPNRLRRKAGRSWADLGHRILRHWIALNKLYCEPPSTLNHDLLIMGHKSIEMQIAIALELCTCSERTSPVAMSAKEFVSATVYRLASSQLAVLTEGRHDGHGDCDCDK